MTRTALYRHYNEAGDLLYVGITDCLTRRDKEHVGADWYKQIHLTNTTWHDDRLEAERAERQAILSENPAFNTLRTNADVPKAPTEGWRGRLNDLVIKSGHSRRYISMSAGLSAGYLHGILIEGKDPTLENIMSICAELGVPLSAVTEVTP